MKQKRYILAFLLIILTCNINFAQSDSTILTYQEFITNILKYHPIAKQADLKIAFAEQEQLLAKGNFDPVISSSWKEKNFDDKQYYRLVQHKVRVPTQIGIDVVGGYENTSGTFLNPENNTDEFGLWNIGIEANLLQGLLIDERRTALKQAVVFQKMALNQQQVMLNDLLVRASAAYLDWQKYDYMRRQIEEGIILADSYLNITRESLLQGEKTRMDTVEAALAVQERAVEYRKNEVLLQKARQTLENYMWFNNLPLELQDQVYPESLFAAIFENQTVTPIDSIIPNLPEILEKTNKRELYQIDQRMKREKLKPKLKLKYNPLLATSPNSIAPQFSTSDYTWGIDFSVPLPMRSERAALQQNRIKIEEVDLDIQNKTNEIRNKLEANLRQQEILREQRVLQLEMIAGYKDLLDGEELKYQYGESSVFLINKRQEKYINGQLKYIDIQAKYQSILLEYLYLINGLVR